MRQVLNATQPDSDSPFEFDGAELSQVTLVAWIRQTNRNATNIQYTLDDGTGQLDVRQWIDNALDEGAKADEFAPNQFVRVLGEIKSFNNKRNITAATVNKLEDHNEYLYHQLDVIYTHLQLTKAEGMRSTKTDVSSTHGIDASVYDDSAMQTADSMAADLSSLSPLQRRIYQAIAAEAPDWPEGVDVQQIIKRCNKHADVTQIQYVSLCICVPVTFSHSTGMLLMNLRMMATSTKRAMTRITSRPLGRNLSIDSFSVHLSLTKTMVKYAHTKFYLTLCIPNEYSVQRNESIDAQK